MTTLFNNGAVRIVRNDGEEDKEPWFETADQIKAIKPAWLLPGRLQANGLAILEGDQGAGKSTLISALVAAVSSGRKWWTRPKQKPRNVLWLAGEEDPGTAIKPRLLAAKADMSRVYFPSQVGMSQGSRITLPAHSGRLRQAVGQLELGLIVVDPLVCYCGDGCDLNSEIGARAVVDPLNNIALTTNCAVLMTRHLRKDRTGPRYLHGLGSMGIGATARSIMVIDYPDNRTERRVCRVVKCSLAPGTALPTECHFTYADGIPMLTGIRDIPRNEDQENGDLADAGERGVRHDARLLLRRILDDGWIMTTAIHEEAEKAGIGLRTLRTAKEELGVRARRVASCTPAHWEWGPPEEGW